MHSRCCGQSDCRWYSVQSLVFGAIVGNGNREYSGSIDMSLTLL